MMNATTIAVAAPAPPVAPTWAIDGEHSTIDFSIHHMVIATVHGRFHRVRGTLDFDPNRPWSASVAAEIDVASIDTGIAKRDDHLRSSDFFDVERYPTISFRSTRVEPLRPRQFDRWTMSGHLTIHGVTRQIDLAVKRIGRRVAVVTFAASTSISRKDFGIVFGLPVERGNVVIADSVAINLVIQANAAPTDTPAIA